MVEDSVSISVDIVDSSGMDVVDVVGLTVVDCEVVENTVDTSTDVVD